MLQWTYGLSCPHSQWLKRGTQGAVGWAPTSGISSHLSVYPTTSQPVERKNIKVHKDAIPSTSSGEGTPLPTSLAAEVKSPITDSAHHHIWPTTLSTGHPIVSTVHSASTVPGWRLSALDRHRPPITAIGWCLDVCHKKNTNASRRQEFSRHWTVSLQLSACYITWHLYSSRDFWRHFVYLGLRRIVAVVLIYTYLLTYWISPLSTTLSDPQGHTRRFWQQYIATYVWRRLLVPRNSKGRNAQAARWHIYEVACCRHISGELAHLVPFNHILAYLLHLDSPI